VRPFVSGDWAELDVVEELDEADERDDDMFDAAELNAELTWCVGDNRPVIIPFWNEAACKLLPWFHPFALVIWLLLLLLLSKLVVFKEEDDVDDVGELNLLLFVSLLFCQWLLIALPFVLFVLLNALTAVYMSNGWTMWPNPLLNGSIWFFSFFLHLARRFLNHTYFINYKKKR
jgi:hypothetical protein